MKNRKIIIGSRGSKLALIYAEKARENILKHAKDFGIEDVDIKEIVTKGDQVQDQRLSEVGGKGLFSKSIEIELLNKNIDVLSIVFNFENKNYFVNNNEFGEFESLLNFNNIISLSSQKLFNEFQIEKPDKFIAYDCMLFLLDPSIRPDNLFNIVKYLIYWNSYRFI